MSDMHYQSPSQRPKLFRDPVHDVIVFDRLDPVEALVLRLIDTRELQRLRRINQLGLASLVFHGAEHSRFAHSLGVFHVARKMVNVLTRQTPISTNERRIVLCAALLHDIGHGPFSHTGERVFDFVHEQWSEQIVLDVGTGVHRALAEVDPTLPKAVADFIMHREGPAAHLTALVSSQLDADRLDYILRDGAATGVGYTYDLPRIIESLELDLDQRRLQLTYRGHDAAEGYLLTRHHMYRNLYFHKTARSAAAMLEAALVRARTLAGDDGLPLDGIAPGFVKMLRGAQMSTFEYCDLDDGDIWRALKAWRYAGDPVLVRLCAGILDRTLYKTIDVTQLEPDQRQALRARIREMLRDAGEDPRWTLLEDESRGLPYQPYRVPEPAPGDIAATNPTDDAIYVRFPDGSVREFSTTSATVRALAAPDIAVRWCVPSEHRSAIHALIREDAGGL